MKKIGLFVACILAVGGCNSSNKKNIGTNRRGFTAVGGINPFSSNLQLAAVLLTDIGNTHSSINDTGEENGGKPRSTGEENGGDSSPRTSSHRTRSGQGGFQLIEIRHIPYGVEGYARGGPFIVPGITNESDIAMTDSFVALSAPDAGGSGLLLGYDLIADQRFEPRPSSPIRTDSPPRNLSMGRIRTRWGVVPMIVGVVNGGITVALVVPDGAYKRKLKPYRGTVRFGHLQPQYILFDEPQSDRASEFMYVAATVGSSEQTYVYSCHMPTVMNAQSETINQSMSSEGFTSGCNAHGVSDYAAPGTSVPDMPLHTVPFQVTQLAINPYFFVAMTNIGPYVLPHPRLEGKSDNPYPFYQEGFQDTRGGYKRVVLNQNVVLATRNDEVLVFRNQNYRTQREIEDSVVFRGATDIAMDPTPDPLFYMVGSDKGQVALFETDFTAIPQPVQDPIPVSGQVRRVVIQERFRPEETAPAVAVQPVPTEETHSGH